MIFKISCFFGLLELTKRFFVIIWHRQLQELSINWIIFYKMWIIILENQIIQFFFLSFKI